MERRLRAAAPGSSLCKFTSSAGQGQVGLACTKSWGQPGHTSWWFRGTRTPSSCSSHFPKQIKCCWTADLAADVAVGQDLPGVDGVQKPVSREVNGGPVVADK